jgi:hypothetical protein
MNYGREGGSIRGGLTGSAMSWNLMTDSPPPRVDKSECRENRNNCTSADQGCLKEGLALFRFDSPPIIIWFSVAGFCVRADYLWCGPSAAPQKPALAQRPLSKSDEVRGLINLDVVVTDNSGRPVSGLRPGTFLCWTTASRRNFSFRAFDGNSYKHDPPVVVILLIDSMGMSGSR